MESTAGLQEEIALSMEEEKIFHKSQRLPGVMGVVVDWIIPVYCGLNAGFLKEMGFERNYATLLLYPLIVNSCIAISILNLTKARGSRLQNNFRAQFNEIARIEDSGLPRYKAVESLERELLRIENVTLTKSLNSSFARTGVGIGAAYIVGIGLAKLMNAYYV